jgi:hypothetical protein
MPYHIQAHGGMGDDHCCLSTYEQIGRIGGGVVEEGRVEDEPLKNG